MGRWYALTAVIILTATTLFVFSFSNYAPTYASTKSRFLANCTYSNGYLTIIANDRGYNNSISHGAPATPWPIIKVHRGDTVNLTLCNLDTVEAHGFAIDTYFDRGVILAPGTAYQISFIASQTGNFRIFCINLCIVHKYMSGSLVVS